MKKIVKVIPQRTLIRYQCGHCGTKYKSLVVAKKCESELVEKKPFCVGDLVSWREMKTCCQYGKNYRLRGIVTKVLGPTLPDEEYNLKWLHGKLTGLHVYQYVVDWKCKYCDQQNSGLFYGMELIKLENKETKKRNLK